MGSPWASLPNCCSIVGSADSDNFLKFVIGPYDPFRLTGHFVNHLEERHREILSLVYENRIIHRCR